MTDVPLLLQPANPPAPFVGRVAERARLAQTIARAPVTVLWGFSGIGKSALLAATLAESFASDRLRTMTVDARSDVDALTATRRVLAQLSMAERPSPPPPEDDTPRALLEHLEDQGRWLVLENIERIDVQLAALLTLALRHARRARISCVCREDPRLPELRTQTIAVAPLPPGELRALLWEVQPSLGDDVAAALVARAQGSPWRLLQLSLGDDADGGPEASLVALAPAAQGLLRTLALVPSALTREVLDRATRLPAPSVLESLARRGYLELGATGMRLHDAARAMVSATLDADERALRLQKLRAALAGTADPTSSAAAAALARADRAQLVGGAGGPTWTVDGTAMRVALADGRIVDLSGRRVLFELLAALCRHRGAATKEQLLAAAWGVREYHPLRHDNRLKVAVRKLRRVLEEELGDDPIEATDDGYRLRGRVRFIAADDKAR